MKTIYNLIKKDIRESEAIKSSVLAHVGVWKRSHFVILSDIIREKLSTSEILQGEKKFELGNTISHITLQRFFENDYQDKTHNDLRFLKTLDKICIFLGYNDLNHYLLKNRGNAPEESSFAEFSPEIILKYCQAEFDFFLSETQEPDNLLHYVFHDSPLFDRVVKFVAAHRKKNMKLVTLNNRSNFEVFDINILADQEDTKILQTQEFWNMLFRVGDTTEEYFVHRLNTQIYFIKNINNEWKIWDNYNPNAGELNHKPNLATL